jgi:hypothetical protein
MSKSYQDKQNEPLMASEPAATYGVSSTPYTPNASVISTENLLSNTMSVDAYFDELISLVHKVGA